MTPIKERLIRWWHTAQGYIHRTSVVTLSAIFLAGILFWGGFNWSIELSNRESYCVSCHEMRDNVYREYQDSVHAINASGVRASCPDCHVPREWFAMFFRKARSLNELYHSMIGSIDTREKFLERRHFLAQQVWNTMQANDSLECRNCHEMVYMNLEQQSEGAQYAHGKALQDGMTCITCHMGIAHDLPESFLDAAHERFERENTPCANCHASLLYREKVDEWDI
mgnify:CR=1 FL=1